MNKPTGVGVGPGGELAVAVRNDDRAKVFDAPTTGGQEAAPTRVVWGAPGYAPGRYAVAWAGRNQSGGPLASGVYLIQLKVRNPETGEVVPTLKKVLVIR